MSNSFKIKVSFPTEYSIVRHKDGSSTVKHTVKGIGAVKLVIFKRKYTGDFSTQVRSFFDRHDLQGYSIFHEDNNK